MNAIELFAGAGGAALGLESAGIHHAALCEWDPSACATMRAAGLGPVVEGDVRDLDAIEAVAGPGPIDLLWSSFPCQAFSTAGTRLGASAQRNGWPWTVDAIDRFRPRWFLGENVRGLLCHSSEGHPDPMRCPRCYLDAVIMPQLRERFAHAGYWLLDAADYGVPQHRRRVILWAGPAPLRAPAATHADPATLAQASMFGPRLLPWVSMGEALGLDRATGATTSQFGDQTPRVVHGPSPSITCQQGKQPKPWKSAGLPFVVAAGETGEGRPRGLEHAAPTIGTGGTAYLVGMTTGSHGAGYPQRGVDGPSPTVTIKVGTAEPWRHSGVPFLSEPAPTVCASCDVGEVSASASTRARFEPGLIAATGRRRLTVRECARLQDFPADQPWQGTKTAQYRQVGNAVPPTLARVVAEVVLTADRA